MSEHIWHTWRSHIEVWRCLDTDTSTAVGLRDGAVVISVTARRMQVHIPAGAFLCVFSRCISFLPQHRDELIRLTGDSQLSMSSFTQSWHPHTHSHSDERTGSDARFSVLPEIPLTRWTTNLLISRTSWAGATQTINSAHEGFLW